MLVRNFLDKLFSISLAIMIAVTLLSPQVSKAGPIDAIKNAILNTASELESIDSEIKQIQVQLNETHEEKRSIQEVIDELKSKQSSLNNKINTAQSNIDTIEANITTANNEIIQLESTLETTHEALRRNLQRLLIIEDETLLVGFLKYDSLSEFWAQIDNSQQLSQALTNSMDSVRQARAKLEEKIYLQENQKAALVEIQNEILVDKESIDIAKQEQDRLLNIVKTSEASYQSLLEEKKQMRENFESDLASYESQLNLVLNPRTIPKPINNKLSWPLANVVITQYFGNTAFAQSGAYNGSGHNGIDLDLVTGTPVMSAMMGTVKGIGNTDAQCPYASYGKWVLIEHPNGISTMYAHLSQISVSPGQTVSRGQVIGYGGNTGYSTGSHLHFTVYRSEGVQISGLPSRSCPGTYITMPLADYSAYLNPIEYLE